jgi:hypothetical protein
LKQKTISCSQRDICEIGHWSQYAIGMCLIVLVHGLLFCSLTFALMCAEGSIHQLPILDDVMGSMDTTTDFGYEISCKCDHCHGELPQ